MSRRETALRFFEDQSDALRLRAESGIELYRKGDAEIAIRAADGSPLPEDAVLEVEQTGHEFRFGANLFMLDEFECEEKNAIYREKFPELFNLATLPFYWKDMEPEEGKHRWTADSPRVYRRPPVGLCVDYCLANGIEPKCHCLNYDVFTPDWAVNLPVQQQKAKLEKRFREIAERYASVIPSLEVTNETLQDCRSAFFYEDDFVEWSFRTADRYFPDNRLIINDYNIWSPSLRSNRTTYYMQIERLLRSGFRHLDSIGFQFHSFFPQSSEEGMAAQRYDPASLYRLMDLYAKLGLREQITEMTIPAYSALSEDEDVQAELIRGVYTTFFSHPSMEAVIYWNLVDGYAHNARPGDFSGGENLYYGGLLRFDMSEKPAYRMLRKLIREEWHTSLVVPVKNGRASFRGFYGDYSLVLRTADRRIPLSLSLSSRANRRFAFNV